MRFNLVLYLLLLTISSYVMAQEDEYANNGRYIINHRILSVEDGLASRDVRTGLVDDDGFIWVGTREGLNRYDGKKMLLFNTSNGLKSNKVIALCKDTKGHLIITLGQRDDIYLEGFQVLDLKTMRFQSLEETFPDAPFSLKYVNLIANDGTKDLYFLSTHPFRLWKYNEQGFRLRCEMKGWWKSEKENYNNPNVFDKQTGSNRLFYKGYIGLSYPTYDDNNPSYFLTPKRDTAFIMRKTTFGLITPDGKWHINRYNEKNVWITFDMLPNGDTVELGPSRVNGWSPQYGSDYLFRYFSDKAPMQYQLRDFGHTLYLMDGKTYIRLFDSTVWKSFRCDHIYNMFEDGYKNVWVCTNSGLLKLQVEKNHFQHFATLAQTQSKHSTSARGIFVDDKGDVYSNIFTKTYKNNEKIGDQKWSNDTTLEILYGLHFVGNRLYLGGRYLFYMDRAAKGSFGKMETLFRSSEFWSFHQLSNRYMLLGSTLYLDRYDLVAQRPERVYFDTMLIPSPSFVYRFMVTKQGRLIAVANNDLYALNKNGDSIVGYWGKHLVNKTAPSPTYHSEPFDNINDVYQQSDTVFWIATNGEGLYRWNTKTGAIKQLTKTDGLSSNIICRIEADKFGNLWLSSDYGLMRFDPKSFSTSTYTTNEGITHNEFNRALSFAANNGMLYFGGMDGVNGFSPAELIADTASSDAPISMVAFSQFIGKQNKLEDLTYQLKKTNSIQLQPEDKFFNMEFQMLDFQEAEHQFAYKIEGIDKEWNYISENTIRISGLPYGNYQLRIKGQDIAGHWSRKELLIPIEMVTPFYFQAWFIITVVVCLVALVWWILYARTKRLLQEETRLEKIVAEQTAELRTNLSQKEELLKEIHHRVKNNLQVISSLLELQSMRLEDSTAKSALEEGQGRVQSIAILHHQLYQHEDLGAVDLKTFADELLRQIAGVFKREYQEVGFLNQIPTTFLDIDTSVPIGLILNELVTNSFKYALPNKNDEQQLLTIQLSLVDSADGYCTIVYKDNGMGMPANFELGKAKSLGLRIVTRLSKQLKGECKYCFEQGARFDIRFLKKSTR